MKDRELLELAAKLYGAKPHIVHTGEYYDDLTPDRLFWNPLRDDGDAAVQGHIGQSFIAINTQ